MQVTIDDFEPIKYIGQGAYGTVWLVRKKATGDEYAMKIVDWEDRVKENHLSILKVICRPLKIDFLHLRKRKISTTSLKGIMSLKQSGLSIMNTLFVLSPNL